MSQAAPRAIAIAKELDRLLRADRGRLLAALASHLGDLSLAEEALQEAAVSALSHWGRVGIPDSPHGWLLTVARRKALDHLRGAARGDRRAEALAHTMVEADMTLDREPIPDQRLRLIFVCCHPALETKSRVALTLRTVCGLTTREIAQAFLDVETTMGQRLSRAKAKITAAGIRFEIPGPEDWPARLDAVLMTLHLIFTTGYVAGPGEPRDLCLEAEYLVRLVDSLWPQDPEVEGALAMMLLTAARRAARVGPDGASVPPGEQDRSLWDEGRLGEGRSLLARALARRRPGPFQIKAAIADCQMFEPAPDWRQIAALYGALLPYEPTSVVKLNAAVAMAEAGDPHTALALVDRLSQELSDFQPWHAARAALLERNGRLSEAAEAYRRAIRDAPGPAEARWLEKRLAGVLPPG